MSINNQACGIFIEINPSYPLDNASAVLVDQSTSNCDAWVFTPELSYVFGDPLMFEWQDPAVKIANLIHFFHKDGGNHADLSFWPIRESGKKKQVISAKRKIDQTADRDMEYGLVYKCRWSEAGLCWMPVGCDLDATAFSSEDFTASREVGADSGGVAYQDTNIALEEVKRVKYLSREIFLQSFKHESTTTEIIAPVIPAAVVHPVKRLDFDALFFQIAPLVQGGLVEEFKDEQTGLSVYNTYTHKSEDGDGSVDEFIM